jgi:hypothetical protein
MTKIRLAATARVEAMMVHLVAFISVLTFRTRKMLFVVFFNRKWRYYQSYPGRGSAAYRYNYLPKTSEAPFIFTSLEGCGPLLERGDPLSPMRVAPTLFRSNGEIALTNQQLLYIEDPAGGD